jgi:hypothetical protein
MLGVTWYTRLPLDQGHMGGLRFSFQYTAIDLRFRLNYDAYDVGEPTLASDASLSTSDSSSFTDPRLVTLIQPVELVT